MKVTVNKNELVHNLKLISQLTKLGEVNHRNSIGLVAKDGVFALFIWIGSAFIYISLPAVVEQEGNCRVSSKLYDVVKVVKDDEIILKYDKALSISTKTKFKARMNEYEGAALPLDLLLGLTDAPRANSLMLLTEELQYLTDLSRVFPPTDKTKHSYVEVNSMEEGVIGSIQPSEEGELEQFPMECETEGVGLYRIQTPYLTTALRFCGVRVKLSTFEENTNNYCISDPENDSWFFYCAKVVS